MSALTSSPSLFFGLLGSVGGVEDDCCACSDGAATSAEAAALSSPSPCCSEFAEAREGGGGRHSNTSCTHCSTCECRKLFREYLKNRSCKRASV